MTRELGQLSGQPDITDQIVRVDDMNSEQWTWRSVHSYLNIIKCIILTLQCYLRLLTTHWQLYTVNYTVLNTNCELHTIIFPLFIFNH